MAVLHWYNETFTGSFGFIGGDHVILYDSSCDELARIDDICGEEWEHLSFEGDRWSTDQTQIPSKFDLLRADIDYLLMLNEE